MIPFYYKGILFSAETIGKRYAQAIDRINDFTVEIESERYVKFLKNCGEGFEVTIAARLNKSLTMVIEVSNKGELFGVYDNEKQCFINVSFDDVVNIGLVQIQLASRMINRYCFVATKEGLSQNLLPYSMSMQWEKHKQELFKLDNIEKINRTVDANLIQSFMEMVHTPEQLKEALRRIENKTLDISCPEGFQYHDSGDDFEEI